MRLSIFCLLGIGLMGCGEPAQQQVPGIEVKLAPFAIKIPAKGELESAKEEAISAPTTGSGALTLAWMKPENSYVEAGEVIAKFDGQQQLLERDKSELELEKNALTRETKERDLGQNQFTLEQQTQLIRQEVDIAERFSVDDLRVYSRNEIIDQLMNKDYLNAKGSYLQWQGASQQERANAELDLLKIKGKSHQDQIQIYNTTLDRLEVKAPQSGMLIYAKNWRGEKTREGQSMWPGMKIASIPALEKMQAKVYVLESEAMGIALGQDVELTLDAYPGRIVKGEVIQVASIASSKQKNNPVKYFEVLVSLDKTDPSYMKPGQKVTATIFPVRMDSTIAVPSQAIFQDKGQSFVYVRQGEGYVKREVEVGKRSLTQAQIITGLQAAEEVALMAPETKDVL